MGKILVFGSSNADMILKTVNIPQKGETVRCEDYKNAAGGKGANQACACAKRGADTVFLSAVGSDQFADMVLSSLRAAGTGFLPDGWSRWCRGYARRRFP